MTNCLDSSKEKEEEKMTITKIVTMTVAILIFSGFGCMAFAAGV